jgi:hypothetical protein
VADTVIQTSPCGGPCAARAALASGQPFRPQRSSALGAIIPVRIPIRRCRGKWFIHGSSGKPVSTFSHDALGCRRERGPRGTQGTNDAASSVSCWLAGVASRSFIGWGGKRRRSKRRGSPGVLRGRDATLLRFYSRCPEDHRMHETQLSTVEFGMPPSNGARTRRRRCRLPSSLSSSIIPAPAAFALAGLATLRS